MENQNLNLPFNFQYNQSCIPPSGLSQPYQMQPFQGPNTQIQSTFMSQPQQNTQGYNQNFQNQQNFNSFGSNFSNNIISNPIPNYSFYVPNQYSTQPSQNPNNSLYPSYTTPQQIQQQQYPIAQPQIQQNQSYLPDTSNFNQGFLQNGQKLQGNAQLQQQNSNQFSTFALTQSFNPQNQNNDNFNITNQIISQNEKLLKAKQCNDGPKNVINLEDDDEEPVTKINSTNYQNLNLEKKQTSNYLNNQNLNSYSNININEAIKPSIVGNNQIPELNFNKNQQLQQQQILKNQINSTILNQNNSINFADNNSYKSQIQNNLLGQNINNQINSNNGQINDKLTQNQFNGLQQYQQNYQNNNKLDYNSNINNNNTIINNQINKNTATNFNNQALNQIQLNNNQIYAQNNSQNVLASNNAEKNQNTLINNQVQISNINNNQSSLVQNNTQKQKNDAIQINTQDDDSSSVQIINPSELQQQSMKSSKPQKAQNLSLNLQPSSNQNDLINNFQNINFLQNQSKQFDQKQLNNFIVNNNSNTNQSNFNQISNNNTNINTNTNLQNNHSEQQLNNINLNNQINGSYKNEIQQNQNQNFKNNIQSQQLSNIVFNQKNNEKLMTNLEKKTSAINDPSLNQINISPFLTSKQSQNHKQQQRHHFNLCIDDDDDSVIFEDKWALEKENNVKNNNNFSSTNYTSNINNNHNLLNNNNGYLGQEKHNINNSINNVSLSKIIMNDQQNSSQLDGQKQILQKQQSFKQKQKLQALEQKRQQKEIQRELKLEKEKEEKKRKVDDRIKQKKQKEEEIYKKKQEEKLIIQQMIHEQQQNQRNDQDYVQKFENYYHIDKYERIWLLCQVCKGRILKSNINDINQTEFDRYQEPKLCPKCAQIKQKQKKLERQEQKLQQKKKKEEEKKIQSADKQNQQLTEEDDEFKAQIMHGPEFQTQLPPYYTNNEEQIKKFKEFHKKRLLSNLLYKGNTQKQEYLKCHGLVKSVVKGNHFSHYDFNNLIQKHNFQFDEINKKLKSEDKSFISTIYQYQGSNSRQTRHKNKRYQYGQEYSNYM